MPNNIITSFASKTGKSTSEVEGLWSEAKKVVAKEYPDVENDSDQYYSIVTGVLKKMLGLTENFNDLVDSEMEQLKLLSEAKKKSTDDEEDEEDEDESEGDMDEDEDEDDEKKVVKK